MDAIIRSVDDLLILILRKTCIFRSLERLYWFSCWKEYSVFNIEAYRIIIDFFSAGKPFFNKVFLLIFLKIGIIFFLVSLSDQV